MKNAWGIFLLCAVFYPAFAQTLSSGDLADGGRYQVICDDANDGQLVAREMEERFAVYNRLFRFDSGEAEMFAPLTVRVFADKDAYDNYVTARLGSVRAGAVYLHYNQQDRRELVIHRGNEAGFLPYQAFIQYFRAFIANPPAWMREGFAVYFSGLGFEDGALTYEENLSWLDTVKGIENPPSIEDILMADTNSIPANFPALAWSIVSFFLNSENEEYIRAMTDSFLLISDSQNAGENAEAVARRISRWIDMEKMEKDYRQYLESRKTFAWLLEEGRRAYAEADFISAELAFLAARDQKPSHHAPSYFLGLLAYNNADFAAAENYYLDSMRLGADSALVSYALGVNAARAGRKEEAADYLRRAAELSPDRYAAKAEELIQGLKERE